MNISLVHLKNTHVCGYWISLQFFQKRLTYVWSLGVSENVGRFGDWKDLKYLKESGIFCVKGFP